MFVCLSRVVCDMPGGKCHNMVMYKTQRNRYRHMEVIFKIK